MTQQSLSSPGHLLTSTDAASNLEEKMRRRLGLQGFGPQLDSFAEDSDTSTNREPLPEDEALRDLAESEKAGRQFRRAITQRYFPDHAALDSENEARERLGLPTRPFSKKHVEACGLCQFRIRSGG